MNEVEKMNEWIDANRERVVSFLRDMVRIPSVNPWFTDYKTDDGELACQRWLAESLREMGFDVEMWEVEEKNLAPYKGMPGFYAGRPMKNRPNLYGVQPGSGGGRSILLTGHVDVVAVGEGWTREPFSGEITDGRMYGRGTVDMKGGIAAMIMAAEAVRQSGVALRGDVQVGIVPDEEAGGMGTLDFVHHGLPKADGAIMTEPTALRLGTMCRGILWGKIVIPGRAGHIEMLQGPWQNGGAVDAVRLAQTFLFHIAQLNDAWAKERTHPLLPMPCQMLVAQVHAGEYPSAYAGKAEISFNVQYLPADRDEKYRGSKIQREVEAFVAAVAGTDPWMRENPPHVEWILDADCAETPADGDFAQSLLGSMGRFVSGAAPVGIGSHTDMGWYVNTGIPTVNFGPGDPKIAHQPDEHIVIDEYLLCVKMLAAMIVDWCG